MRIQAACVLLFLSIALASPITCQLKLPRLISDGMVLQRNSDVKIWGWTRKGEKVSVFFCGKCLETYADDTGSWEVLLKDLKPGGPHDMFIISGDTQVVSNILVGDVWICSGQSNMVLSMERVRPLYETELTNAQNKFLRYFMVPERFNFREPEFDFESGSWQEANPSTVPGFSATAYFFARELYEKYGIPVGLINASLGGSPAEAWMSENALGQFPEHLAEAMRFRDAALIDKIKTEDRSRILQWHNQLRKEDKGHNNGKSDWFDPELSTGEWPYMDLPGYWWDSELGSVNGSVWFRKEISIPSTMVGKKAGLNLGCIVDFDSVYLNGIFIGSTAYRYPPRRYQVPEGILKEGKNVIVVRVINYRGKGGFVPDKPLFISDGDHLLDLSGPWQYRLGAEMGSLQEETFIRWKPMGLFNGMISPLLNYRIKGVIWYQGEANTSRSFEYRKLFPALIRDWRHQWNQGVFPFLYVQLANYMEPDSLPGESNWALLRESQLKALSIPGTAMAVTIDIGEWNDIHPLNKKDVGTRLALAARRLAYGETSLVHSGPIFRSMEIDGNRIVLSFDHVGSGLVARGDTALRHFAIAGGDKLFSWARAVIEKNTVVVWHDGIKQPKYVRYAWADNPERANLYNKEGLPASPFRTDE